eukprot:CAMPEP_0170538218 /NCGR_PEP_ID=MMETSP0209-20121228/103180_1 /TAXON_ID=665100 ORGANISM="Litonotus pictus, Strain P1" /NCGR_SAMPLE_ID=MMETSP0209 /ASSEMBLY_ACC=CAM_ASM_000301 /LENGTH=241 /DNA_ID=CAMNT_0010839867 /DNA_START=1021 /DNA_END=1743 /DNA_ORIENTATION=+
MILYDSNHLFDKIFITEDKAFSEKHGFYNNNPMLSTLPQIYIKNTHSKSQGGGTFELSYFKFPDDFSQFLSSSLQPFKHVNKFDNKTYVESLNGENFKAKLLEDSSFRECVLEIKHEGCPTCLMLGKMLDHMSQKFHKHGKLSSSINNSKNKVRFFRIDSDNDIPLLGRFNATPVYLYIRKDKDNKKIEFIAPLEKQEFLFRLRKYCKNNLDRIKYHPNLTVGFMTYQNKEFSKPDYDPDY